MCPDGTLCSSMTFSFVPSCGTASSGHVTLPHRKSIHAALGELSGLAPKKKSRTPSRGPGLLPVAESGWLFGDPVAPGVADLLADDRDPVLLRQRPARAHQGARGVCLPAELP